MRVFTIVTALAAIFLISTSMGLPQGQKEALQEKIHRGQRLYRTYGCADCHQVLGKGGKGGPDLSRVTVWASPLLGAAVMWNHVKVMELAMKKRFLQWPEFKGEDITDIFTYLHSLNPQKGGIYLYPGKASFGRETYGEAGCQTCHGEPFGGGHIGSDLGKNCLGIEESGGIRYPNASSCSPNGCNGPKGRTSLAESHGPSDGKHFCLSSDP